MRSLLLTSAVLALCASSLAHGAKDGKQRRYNRITYTDHAGRASATAGPGTGRRVIAGVIQGAGVTAAINGRPLIGTVLTTAGLVVGLNAPEAPQPNRIPFFRHPAKAVGQLIRTRPGLRVQLASMFVTSGVGMAITAAATGNPEFLAAAATSLGTAGVLEESGRAQYLTADEVKEVTPRAVRLIGPPPRK